MKQMYLVCYLESKDCKEVRKSSQGYYVMRNTKTGAICGVPMPSDGEDLKEETICNICNVLGVEIPPSSEKEINEVMALLKEDVENRINNGNL